MIRLATIALCLACLTARGQDWNMLGNLLVEPGASSAYTPTAATNLVGWWTFASGDGSYQADMSGNGNYMTQATASARATISGGYASLDGGDRMAITNTALLNGNGVAGFTATAWVNVSTWTANASIFAPSAMNCGIELNDLAPPKIYAVYNSTKYKQSVNTYESNVWFFVSASGNTTNCTVGMSGVYSSLAYTTAAMSIASVWGICNYSTVYWTGYIDDVRLYNRSLTTNEINLIYGEGRR